MSSRLLPLSRVAGSLALSFTGAAHAAAPAAPPPPTTAAPPGSVVPAPPPTTTTAPPMAPVTRADVRAELADADAGGGKSDPPPRPTVLRPTERRFFFTMFVGGSKGFLGGYPAPYGGGMDFKVEGAIGGHGRERRNLAGAAVVQVTSGFPFSSFTLAPRLQWDKQLLPDYAIYMTTTLTAGYRAMTYGGYGLLLGLFGGETIHSGVFAVGWGASTIVAERLLLTFRPVNVELVGPGVGFPVQINYDVLGGIGVVW